MSIPSCAMRENAQILLYSYECFHCKRVVMDLTATFIMIDAHHIAILITQWITVHTAINATFGHYTTTKVWTSLDLDF